MASRSEEHTSELQSPQNLVCRLLLEKKKERNNIRSGCTVVRAALAGAGRVRSPLCRPRLTPLRPLSVPVRCLFFLLDFFFLKKRPPPKSPLFPPPPPFPT